MKSEIASMFPFPWLAAAACLMFAALFVGALLWVHRPGSRDLYERLERLPLDENK